MMITMGLIFASGMVIYWDSHTRPFRPLQNKLAIMAPAYMVSVSGGKAERTAGKPMKLKIIFRPVNHDHEVTEQDLDTLTTLAYEQAKLKLDLSPYEIFEVLILRDKATPGQKLLLKSMPLHQP